MTVQTASPEVWPAWARALFIALVVVGLIAALPWIFMWTTMAASCVPMMGGMPQMTTPGMR
ncbi:MAG: hypothetical protein ACRDG6_09655 [Candidatus Limnocylindria bacterium]